MTTCWQLLTRIQEKACFPPQHSQMTTLLRTLLRPSEEAEAADWWSTTSWQRRTFFNLGQSKRPPWVANDCQTLVEAPTMVRCNLKHNKTHYIRLITIYRKTCFLAKIPGGFCDYIILAYCMIFSIAFGDKMLKSHIGLILSKLIYRLLICKNFIVCNFSSENKRV